MPIRLVRSSGDSRGKELLARLLRQKRGPDTVMVGVLVVALVLGLVGLAVHVLWIVAIIVMALGLGFAFANVRRDRLDEANRNAEVTADQTAAGPGENVRPAAPRK